jgi:hypothetical protein
MSRRFGLLVVITVLAFSSACARLRPPADAPAYFTQVTDKGWLYAHNWASVPCFTIELMGETWRLAGSNPNKVDWVRGDEFLSIIFSDNRRLGYAVAGMLPEDVLRAYLGYEAEHIRPLFEYQIIQQPKFTTEHDGTWMGWGWEGRGGKRRGAKTVVAADQQHVIMSLWQDPFVISFDWGSKKSDKPGVPTLEMVMLLESLAFHPECFSARRPARGGATGKPYAGTDFTDRIEDGEGGDGFETKSSGPRPYR